MLSTNTYTPTTTTFTMATGSSKPFSLNTNPLNEYHKGLLVAASSQMYNVPSTVKLSDILSNSATISQCTGTMSNPGSPQFGESSPAVSNDSMEDRSRHTSNESIDSPAPNMFSLSSVKEEQSQSPGRSGPRRKTDLDPSTYREHRRASHINAEQKRRYTIKNGFDTLVQLVPSLTQTPNAKVSKAAILTKSADYCLKLQRERAEKDAEIKQLTQESKVLENAIKYCQSQLPDTGVPVTRQKADKMKEQFNEYVRERTLLNWKFWIFSVVMQPLFDSYNNMVSMATMEEFYRTTMSWLDQHCSLPQLRPGVSGSLLHLNKNTSILSDPSNVPKQAIAAVQTQCCRRTDNGDSNSH